MEPGSKTIWQQGREGKLHTKQREHVAAVGEAKQRGALKYFRLLHPSRTHLQALQAREVAEVEADAGATYVVAVDTPNTLAIGKVDTAHEQLEGGNMNRSLVVEAELVGALLVLAMDHCCGVVEKIAVGGAVEAVEDVGAQDK